MSACTRPLVRYHGGKWKAFTRLERLFPEHRVYVEPFGGGGSVLLRKPRSYAEIYNDLDGEIVNLFRMTRDRGEELKRAVELTPFARVEYAESWQPSNDPLEQARRTLIRAFMGFGSAAVTMARSNGSKRPGKPATGFRSNSNRSGTTPAHDWQHFSAALVQIIERLRGVVIENRDAREVIAAHDSPDTFHYLDPPYPLASRDAGTDYVHEMTDEQHCALKDFLGSVRGKVIISGYGCELYDWLYADWYRTEFSSLADGARKRTEVAWMNFTPMRLFA